MARKKQAPEMTDPILHGIPNWKLPDDHFLNTGHDLLCEHCDGTIYDSDAGTVATWVETGAWLDVLENEGGHVKSTYLNFCIRCFAQFDDVAPVMDNRFCFHSDTFAPPQGQYTKKLAAHAHEGHDG